MMGRPGFNRNFCINRNSNVNSFMSTFQYITQALLKTPAGGNNTALEDVHSCFWLCVTE